jgi:tRNA(Ile)-lysidine synthase
MNLDVILKPFLDCRRWWIAYSGGVDSHVLLHLLAHLRKQQKIPPLTALHINHQLNPRAQEWVEHCRRVCAKLDVEFIAETVRVVNVGEGIEATARAARYAAFEKYIRPNELLLQAHHRDDQIETLMLRLLRGSGITGLAAMPVQRALGRGQLLRPLLQCPRSDVLAYAKKNALQWVDDDSNSDDRFDRNFLRLNVLPLIEQRWPAYRETLSRVITQADEAAQLLDELAHIDWQNAVNAEDALLLSACKKLSAERQGNLLRYWLRQKNLPQPSREQLLQVLAMAHARIDAQPCVRWSGVEVHRFREHLYAMAQLPLLPLKAIDIEWDMQLPLHIEGFGELTVTAAVGSGLRTDLNYRVRNRVGGERCKPIGRAHSQTLKKLLQEYAVPPWLRDRLPLIYCEDQLAAVGSVWICEGFQARGDEVGWRVMVSI